MSELLTVAQVAKMLSVHPMTVYRMVHEGSLGSVRIRKSLRIPKAAVAEYLGGRWPEIWADHDEN